MTDVPRFRYHPDPVGTGEVITSDAPCRCCGRRQEFIYTGPVYAEEEVVDELCLPCIADGSAATLFEAEFTDFTDVPDDVPRPVLTEVLTRTPGFSGWQQEHWMFHCADAAAYLGKVGYAELQAFPEALEMVMEDSAPEQAELRVRSLRADGEATGYLFRCLHCGTHLAYADRS
ncbi:CbrC family protein [Kribbella sp. CA-293567]|uniref:CbrC family protein n=1 Tax=Kribbella sp. CA-293567 TaxID=3002436 RepID=UPI0022DDDDEC|nr:CbrC family protein [Kribbella sp. CA-293567]WBQ05322.1 CbrC family protein [Kribbella sp. CA-293567]